MRISDWSSDVCSSDLTRHGIERLIILHGLEIMSRQTQAAAPYRVGRLPGRRQPQPLDPFHAGGRVVLGSLPVVLVAKQGPNGEIGRASCRERVCQYV